YTLSLHAALPIWRPGFLSLYSRRQDRHLGRSPTRGGPRQASKPARDPIGYPWAWSQRSSAFRADRWRGSQVLLASGLPFCHRFLVYADWKWGTLNSTRSLGEGQGISPF